MKIFLLANILLFNLLVIGCAASVSPNRHTYILAHKHGWIEVNVSDDNIYPAVKEEDNSDNQLICHLDISLNNEPYLRESIYPFNDEPPYQVKTGFRFVAPTGDQVLRLTYSGCGENKESPIVIFHSVNVLERMVTLLSFDGVKVSIEDTKESKSVTLEKIYESLKEIEKKIED